MSSSTYDQMTFTSPLERCRRLNQVILRHVDPGRALTVLDIGCGTGGQVFSLAEALPRGKLVGVDISAANIRIAESILEQDANAARIEFHNCDYLAFRAGQPTDLIVSYSTLHLIPAEPGVLFEKIAAELAPGGIFVNVMPVSCAYNFALKSVRRLLRSVRGRVSDALILACARFVHGKSASDEVLRERTAYMYEIPRCFDGPDLQRLLVETLGLESVECEWEIHASPGQMKHTIHVFRKKQDLA